MADIKYFDTMYICTKASAPAAIAAGTITKAALLTTPFTSFELREKAGVTIDKNTEVVMGSGTTTTTSDKVDLSAKVSLTAAGMTSLYGFRNTDVHIIFVDSSAVNAGTISECPCVLGTRVNTKFNIIGNDDQTIEIAGNRSNGVYTNMFKWMTVTSA